MLTEVTKVELTKDIFDNGDDHHPPGYLARKGEIVVVREIKEDKVIVSHEHIKDCAFIVYKGEFENVRVRINT